MPGIQYSDNTMEYVKMLHRAGIDLEEAAAEAINEAADLVSMKYKRELTQKKRLRNKKFTLGAVKVLKARLSRSGGRKRSIHDLNAIVGVMNLRGEDHYLAKMEQGGIKKGGQNTHGKAAIPLDTARGGDRNRPIQPKYRLAKGKPVFIGDKVRAMGNPRQEYAIMYSMAKRGKLIAGSYQTDTAIYNVTRKKITMIRKAEDDSIEIKSDPLFEGATNSLREIEIDRFFERAARRILGRLTKTS